MQPSLRLFHATKGEERSVLRRRVVQIDTGRSSESYRRSRQGRVPREYLTRLSDHAIPPSGESARSPRAPTGDGYVGTTKAKPPVEPAHRSVRVTNFSRHKHHCVLCRYGGGSQLCSRLSNCLKFARNETIGRLAPNPRQTKPCGLLRPFAGMSGRKTEPPARTYACLACASA